MPRLVPAALLLILTIGAFLVVPPIPQDPDYHAFAPRAARAGRPSWKV